MSTYLINDSTLSSIADAIRQKDGISGTITPTAMASRIADFNTEEATVIEPYQYQSSKITSFSSDADYVLEGAFAYCSILTSVNISGVTVLGARTFLACSALSTIDFPNCTHVGGWTFRNCARLSQLNLPNCEVIGNRAFQSCGYMRQVNFPNCKFIQSSAFYSCRALSDLSFPVCKYIGESAFYRCSLVLSVASFPACEYIEAGAFAACTRLKTFYLTGSSVVTLASSNVFQSTGLQSIYVPSSLLTDYQTAVNWSIISSKFVGI